MAANGESNIFILSPCWSADLILVRSLTCYMKLYFELVDIILIIYRNGIGQVDNEARHSGEDRGQL